MANVVSVANVFRVLGCVSANQLISEIGTDRFLEVLSVPACELPAAIAVFDAVIALGGEEGFWW